MIHPEANEAEEKEEEAGKRWDVTSAVPCKTCWDLVLFLFFIEEIKPERNIFFIYFLESWLKKNPTNRNFYFVIFIIQSSLFRQKPAEEVVRVKIITGPPG